VDHVQRWRCGDLNVRRIASGKFGEFGEFGSIPRKFG